MRIKLWNRSVFMLVPLALFLLLLSGCSSGAAPDEAVRKGFEQWTKDSEVAYRNVSYKIVSNQESLATVEVKGEFQYSPTSSWIEEQTVVEVSKNEGEWAPPSIFSFSPTERALADAPAAPPTLTPAPPTPTATAWSDQKVEPTPEAETPVPTETTQLLDRKAALEASVDFSSNRLPEGWKVIQSDQNAYRLGKGFLEILPLPPTKDGQIYNTFVRKLPPVKGDLNVTIKLHATPTQKESQVFYMRLQAGEQTRDQTISIGTSPSDTGPEVYARSLALDSSERTAKTSFEQDVYLRISRRDSNKYTTFFSHDGETWSYLSEWDKAQYGQPPNFDTVLFRVSAKKDAKDTVAVYWVRFEVP